ncbi:ABC transporter permease [Nigerium massiliense]|uniref:ABC transporter permease n=1 Tax=Nigerium massiliense TaxID=1522317 RepID=UPI00058F36EA|nr:ABC transporter permease [Nigerium massiliense]
MSDAVPSALAPHEAVTPSDEPIRGASLGRYLATKALGAAISLLMVVVLGFFAFRILPGDPVLSMTRGRMVTPEEIARLRREFGLDQPLVVQFGRYLADLTRGDLGTSFFYNAPVSRLIAERAGSTLLLTGTAAVISIVLGLWLGQRAAWKRNSGFDKATTGLALVFWSVPTFWLGLLLLMAFGGPLPTGGMITPGLNATGFAYVVDVARHLVLPVAAMVAVTYAQYLMTMRSSMLEEMTADYLTTARAKGLNEDGVRTKHAVPNALLPTVTIIFMTLGHLIGGAITVETVFSWPGLGYLTYQALSAPDLPLLQGTFVVFSSIVVIMNFLADLVYRVLDPRLKAA